MRKNVSIGTLRTANGKTGIADAIPAGLFVRDPFPELPDADEQGRQNAGFDEKAYQCNGGHRQKAGRGQLLAGGEIRAQKIDCYQYDGNTKQDPFVFHFSFSM